MLAELLQAKAGDIEDLSKSSECCWNPSSEFGGEALAGEF